MERLHSAPLHQEVFSAQHLQHLRRRRRCSVRSLQHTVILLELLCSVASDVYDTWSRTLFILHSGASASTGGLFGAPASTGGLFGAAPSTGGLFGAPASTGGLFGAAPSTGGGLFGAPAAAGATPSTGGGLFGAAPSTGGLFGAAPSTGGGLFGAPKPAGGLFGSSPGVGAFGATATAPVSIFGQAGQTGAGTGMFGATAPQAGALVLANTNQAAASSAIHAQAQQLSQEQAALTRELQRLDAGTCPPIAVYPLKLF